MFKANLLAQAVRVVVAGGALAVAVPALAATTDVAATGVERIEVTGSRIKRTDLEGASPVTVMTSEQMKAEGIFTVADALRRSTVNSFGSLSEKSGSAAQSQATVDLRGVGDSRTLVLLDGKRIPGSPTLEGATTNLNMIPMAAVERIEILTDGASATYGSDAVAGVVNIITKKNYEGVSVAGNWGQASAEGGDSRDLSLVAGASNDKGNLTFAFEHAQHDAIYDRDRWYTAPRYADLDGDGEIELETAETEGMNFVGATFFDPLTFESVPATNCAALTASTPGFVGEMADGADAAYGHACGYAYAEVSANKASLRRDSVYVDGNYTLNPDLELFGRVNVVRGESFGRYAPAAVLLGFTDDYLVPVGQLGNPFAEAAPMAYRFAAGGTRDNSVTDYSQDYLLGLRGTVAGGYDWETYYHRNQMDSKNVGQNYFSIPGLALNLAAGIPLDSPAGIANMRATTLQEDKGVFNQWFAGVGFDALHLPGGAIAHFIGTEYFDQSYASMVDAQTQAGLIGGAAGGSAQGERDVQAAFYEAVLPLMASLELNLAARYDNYSDFGSNVAPKAALRWAPHQDVVVRTSYGEGFRAPSMKELYSAGESTAETARDFVTCADVTACDARQYTTLFVANPQLEAETSRYLNLGAAWAISDNVAIKLDGYHLQIDDVIDAVSTQDLIWAEYFEQDLGIDNVALVRGDDGGAIQYANTTYINKSKVDTKGLDLTIDSLWPTTYGDWSASLMASKVLDYQEETYYQGGVQDRAGWALKPDLRANVRLGWARNGYRFVYSANYIGSTYESENPEVAGDQVTGKLTPYGRLDSWLLHNLQLAYDAGRLGVFSLGVNNLTNEDPVLSSSNKYEIGYEDLYNNYGRVYNAGYAIDF